MGHSGKDGPELSHPPPFGKGLLPPGGPRSILVVMMSAVGDAVQVLPVLNGLRRAFPNCRIDWLIQPGPYALVRDHPTVDDFILFHRGPRGRHPAALALGARALQTAVGAVRESAHRHPGGGYDLLLDLQVYFKAGALTALAPARVKLGFDWRRTRDLNFLFTTHRIPPHPGGFAHTQDQYLEFLRYLGVNPDPLIYGLSLTDREREAQRAFFQEQERPTCAMVVASSSPKKDWSPEGYARVAEEVHRRMGLRPLLVGGDSAREKETVQRIQSACRVPTVVAMRNDIRQLLWILHGSRVVISPDTGPLHMSRAMEVPVVGLYGFTNPKRSGPYRMFQDLVVDGYARQPGEEYPITPRCRPGGMGRITPDDVLRKVELALERSAR